jgi:hypothetical protein
MTRSILAALAAVAGVAVLSGTGCQASGVGDPCTPEAEYTTSFLGFSVTEVNTESESFQCLTRLCLVNHFQGRVSCPYGSCGANNPDAASSGACAPSAASGSNLSGTQSCDGKGDGCCIPGTQTPVDGKDSTGMQVDPKLGASVAPQCTDRTADKAVYCSCRCANLDGQTNDGRNYCTCPDGFECKQLVASVGGNADQGLTGAYCIKKGTAYDANNVCGSECDPKKKNCGTAQGVGM